MRKLWVSLLNDTEWSLSCRKVTALTQKTVIYQVLLPEALIPKALTFLHGNVFSGAYFAESS
jgi:hypothetical protein